MHIWTVFGFGLFWAGLAMAFPSPYLLESRKKYLLRRIDDLKAIGKKTEAQNLLVRIDNVPKRLRLYGKISAALGALILLLVIGRMIKP